ncbi:MAG: hypothetical protein JXB20_02050, partial [Bacilli bacterium]|nr:hypothetical protein [Bacilli bacterium]
VNHGKEKSYLVVCNFREYPIAVKLENRSLKGYNPLFYNTDNIPTLDKQMHLEPYDAIVYVRK